MSAPPGDPDRELRVDLHVHSTASDGALPPASVVEAAIAGELDVLALADHDTTAGVLEAQEAAGARMRVIPAMEISATDAGREVHVLGYHVDPLHPALATYSREARERRSERAREILAKLRGLGVELDYADVEAMAAGAAVGRPHVARALVARGHVASEGAAFERWLRDGGPAFVPTDLVDPAGAIDVIHRAGGLAVWAHPGTDDVESRMAGYAASGLDGVECYRPRSGPVDIMRLERAAADLRLLLSGGSDWHGEWNGTLGTFHVPAARVAPLLDWKHDDS